MKDLDKLSIRAAEGGSTVAVKAVPGASRDRVVGVLGDCLKIATAAAAEKGKANAAIARTLAAALHLPRRNVALRSGPTSPRKEFRVAGLSPAEVRARLGGAG